MIVIEFVFKLCQAPTVFIGYGFDTAESDSSKYISEIQDTVLDSM